MAQTAPDAAARPQTIEAWRTMLGKAEEKRAVSFVQRHPGRAAVGAAAAAILLGVVLWRVLHPVPVPPQASSRPRAPAQCFAMPPARAAIDRPETCSRRSPNPPVWSCRYPGSLRAPDRA